MTRQTNDAGMNLNGIDSRIELASFAMTDPRILVMVCASGQDTENIGHGSLLHRDTVVRQMTSFNHEFSLIYRLAVCFRVVLVGAALYLIVACKDNAFFVWCR